MRALASGGLLLAIAAAGLSCSPQKNPDLPGRAIADGERSVALLLPEYELRGLKPGDRVDVLDVFDTLLPNQARTKVVATVLQDVKVLDVRLTGKLDSKAVLYLQLNPVESQYAELAALQGEMSVILRKSGDYDVHPMEMASFQSFFR